MTINSPEELAQLENGNRFLGTPPEMKSSAIRFNGRNNVLYCEEGVVLDHCSITFHSDNSLVVLGKSSRDYKIGLAIHNDSVCFFGRDCNFIDRLTVVTSERKHFFAGNDALFSRGIWARNADPHLIYDCETKLRANPSKSVFLGDHVWIGQGAMLLKGTEIDSGSIVGGMSLVSGKKIPHNTAWAGNPAKQVREGIFWDGACVHFWAEDMTELSQNYRKYAVLQKDSKPDAYIYSYNASECRSFAEIDALFDTAPMDEKLTFAKKLLDEDAKNRFVHEAQEQKKPSAGRSLFGKKRS